MPVLSSSSVYVTLENVVITVISVALGILRQKEVTPFGHLGPPVAEPRENDRCLATNPLPRHCIIFELV